MTNLRFSPEAARELRDAIRDAGGVEVFAIGDIEGRVVQSVTIVCRGTEDRVPALLERPRSGQVVIHNHPSGDLRPSDADMGLAARYGDDGVGVVIVDSMVERDHWVVEPHTIRLQTIDRSDVERCFVEDLPRAIEGYEARESQLRLAYQVLEALNDERPVIAEAGTGTGKSLAYLVPAALWALANDEKVVVSTYTRSLQAQLLTQDLPLLTQAGIRVRAAVLQGRNNYLCKRRLGLAIAEEPDNTALQSLAEWERTTEHASRSELSFDLEPDLWEQIESDSDATLSVRCPHYESCHYYRARREAAAAHIIVVNHALLLADRSLKLAGAPGILPKYKRLIIDEAHHLEDAATNASAERISPRAIQRATAPLLTRARRIGVLEKIARRHVGSAGPLDLEAQEQLRTLLPEVDGHIHALRDEGAGSLAMLGNLLEGQHRRLTTDLESSDDWLTSFEPLLIRILDLLSAASDHVARLHALFAEVKLKEPDLPPIHDLARARRRLAALTQTASAFLDDNPDQCRWMDPPPSPKSGGAILNIAPIQVSGVLRRMLWDPLPGAACTSATLTVNSSFAYFERRTGLRPDEALPLVVPSPFDYERQAVLGLPTDLPEPEDPTFMSGSSQMIAHAVRLAGGGTFVLCTSHAAVDHYARYLAHRLPPSLTVLAQGRMGRNQLLRRFRDNPRSVLVGTDAFWEGISVKGWALRQVIVPRLPFRVPSDPLHLARVEAEQHAGRDPFRSIVLPQAVLRLRQGFGRLIRSQRDCGVVLILDRRLHERAYGRVILHSLPPARRIQRPWDALAVDLQAYWELQRAAKRGTGP
jgi:ATP-dependent DNA helicase DinG